VYDGGVRFERSTSASTAKLALDPLVIDETQALAGELVVDVGAGQGAFSASLGSAGFQIVNHGGIASGLSCGDELVLSRASLFVDESAASIGFDARRAAHDGSVAMSTFGSDLTFDAAQPCACPSPGGGVIVDVPRPLGVDGDTARARITYGKPTDPHQCASASVELVDWPSHCDPWNDVDGDCGQSATEATLSALLSALCFNG
jgi:hypothetical protein